MRMGLLLAVALLAVPSAGWGQARPTPLTDSTSVGSPPGTGASYWGLIPTAADSTTIVFSNAAMPFWEATLVWPYRVVSFPVRAFAAGVGASIDFLERTSTLERVGKLFGPRTGPFGVLVNVRAGGLAGMGVGLTAEHTAFLGSDNRLRVGARTTTRGNHQGHIGADFAAGRSSRIEVGAGWRVRPNARYFGLGPGAEEGAESFFRHETMWLGASYGRDLGSGFSLTGAAIASTVEAGPPDDDESPPITGVFAGELPNGFDEDSQGITLGLSLVHEDVEGAGRPARGGIRRLHAAYFEGLDQSDVAFWTFRGEAQQFVTLWHRHHVLALRGYMSWIGNVGSDALPFQRLMTNDDPDLLRGYRDFRWRGRGMVALSAEYRWPLWVLNRPDSPGLDLYLLADIGQVYNDIDEIATENLTFSYGAGVRLIGARNFVARIEYGRSEEQAVWRLRFDQIFQFSRGGLFNGRVPVPDR
ncbi:MAG: BamA/TamA family outer membrane protein [Gemmatimonadales bacterium]|nr:BamA/TamA family outer membrane protein [Gemmatimonadales bacterium]